MNMGMQELILIPQLPLWGHPDGIPEKAGFSAAYHKGR
jgi:hypothetical protein